MMAYDLSGAQIFGPDWLSEEMYDILATMPRGTTAPDFKLMVQNLLAERFKMTVHRETKEVEGYSLEVAPKGLRITESKRNPEPVLANPSAKGDPAITAPVGVFVDKNGFPAPLPDNSIYPPGAGFAATIRVGAMFRVTALNMPMSEFAKYLSPATGMPTVDHTELTGVYDVHLEYKPTGTPPPLDGRTADIDTPGPDLFDAVQSQLGLKLVRRKVPQEILVIDHLEKVPTEN
jgi:uncharacterized protein (TIGR03435 family)